MHLRKPLRLAVAAAILCLSCAHAAAALIVDARVDGVARSCAAATEFTFKVSGGTSWHCGATTQFCWSELTHVYQPTDDRVVVDCTTSRPPWATDFAPGHVFASGFE